MKKFVIASVLSCVTAMPALAQSGDFTLNPMVGVAHNKEFGSQVALGLEGAYKDFIFGYAYNGDKESNGTAGPLDLNDETPIMASAYSKDKYRAHQLYLGYQFQVGSGHLALKAGAELSKRKINAGLNLQTAPGHEDYHNAGFDLSASSSNVWKPMVGVGYYLDNGLNFNLHYTIHSGNRAMKGQVNAYDNDNSATEATSGNIKDRDLSTLMFTVGYRF
ncbi:outer membrane beta-barrel protein [Ferrimonas kyonanensis]|uniref:outer membrane beta-barrel protein n=1 Tax=Ferrimonas kyonanensis TaxID=364763 RepID=UPI00040B82A6|nr:outer membrane beta-barrel protein [Ferrimonas kyonanensis]